MSEHKNFSWRHMLASDLDRVNEIANKVHVEFPEDPEVFAERLTLFPSGCFVLEDFGEVRGYAITHPWTFNNPPSLNQLLGTLPRNPDTYYIHDVALLPVARGRQAVPAVWDKILKQGKSLGLVNLSGIAVNNTGRLWQRFGCQTYTDPALVEKLASYSADARYMTCDLPSSW